MCGTIQALLAVAKLRTPQEVKQFDACLVKLDPTSLTKDEVSKLLCAFDDDVEHIDVAWGLLHLVEKVPLEVYLSALTECATKLRRDAPEWLDTIVARCANSTTYRTALVQAVNVADAECKAAIIDTLRTIQTSAPVQARAAAEECLVLLGTATT